MNTAKSIVVGALGWAAMMSGAHAATFSGSYSETYNTASPGLRIGAQTLQTDSLFDFTIDKGETTTLSLYQLYTPETTVNGDDTTPENISTSFSFTGPDAVDSTITGKTVGVKSTDSYAFPGFDGNHQYGQVAWDATEQVYFSDGLVLDITLTDATFNEGEYYALDHGSFPYSGTSESNGAPITAVFTLEGVPGSVSSAPEPTSWALMIAGVALTGAALRRVGRRGQAAIAA